MTDTYLVSKAHQVFAFDASIPPVLEVDAPATIKFEVENTVWSRLEKGETVEAIGFHNFNALAGSVFIKGAEAGDTLQIDILDIQVKDAWSCWMPELGRLGDLTDTVQLREIPIEDGHCIINEQIRVPVDPMIGCIGVAPAEGSGSTVRPAYPWGGNMDLLELRVGTTLYLPVQVKGALLSLGDFHAAMGTAELTSVSLESNGQATVSVSVLKDMAIDYPRVRVGTETLFIASSDNFTDSKNLAAKLAYNYLTKEKGLSAFDGYAYMSARVALRFGGPASVIIVAVVPDFDG